MYVPPAQSDLKMRDLERLTGVNRETIRVYLREKLLPEPHRPKPNVAVYSEAHVRAIHAVRELQHDQRLSLAQIRRAMAGDMSALSGDPGAFAHLDTLVAARLGVDDALVPLTNVAPRNPSSLADARALAEVGAISIRDQDGQQYVSPTDAQILDLWGEMRAAGFTEDVGFMPGITRFYVEEAATLAGKEVTAFLAAVGGRMDEARIVEMAQSAINLMLPFFGLLRMKAVIAEFARHAEAGTEGAPKAKPVRPRRARTKLA